LEIGANFSPSISLKNGQICPGAREGIREGRTIVQIEWLTAKEAAEHLGRRAGEASFPDGDQNW
jgi:hypothetical protein